MQNARSRQRRDDEAAAVHASGKHWRRELPVFRLERTDVFEDITANCECRAMKEAPRRGVGPDLVYLGEPALHEPGDMMTPEVPDLEIAGLATRIRSDPCGERRKTIPFGQAMGLDEEQPLSFRFTRPRVPIIRVAPDAGDAQNRILVSENFSQRCIIELRFGAGDHK